MANYQLSTNSYFNKQTKEFKISFFKAYASEAIKQYLLSQEMKKIDSVLKEILEENQTNIIWFEGNSYQVSSSMLSFNLEPISQKSFKSRITRDNPRFKEMRQYAKEKQKVLDNQMTDFAIVSRLMIGMKTLDHAFLLIPDFLLEHLKLTKLSGDIPNETVEFCNNFKKENADIYERIN